MRRPCCAQLTRQLPLTRRLACAVGKQEREQLLAQDCAAKFIKRARSKATAFDVATELVAMRGGAGAAAASSAPMPSQGQMVEQLAMAQRASDLVAALTEAGGASRVAHALRVSNAADEKTASQC